MYAENTVDQLKLQKTNLTIDEGVNATDLIGNQLVDWYSFATFSDNGVNKQAIKRSSLYVI